jgi:hypothetical protein
VYALTGPVRGGNGSRSMRALVAAGLALFLVLSAATPHVHTGEHADESCAVCVARHADVPRTELPDLAPAAVVEATASLAIGLPPVDGAPLGAIPGQSPPRAA